MRISGLFLMLILILIASIPTIAVFAYAFGFTAKIIVLSVVGSSLSSSLVSWAFNLLVTRNKFDRFFESIHLWFYRKFGAVVIIKYEDFRDDLESYLRENSFKYYIIKDSNVPEFYDDEDDLEESWGYEILFFKKSDAVRFKLMWPNGGFQ